MAIIVSFDTTTLEGLVNTLEKKVGIVTNAPLREDRNAERARRQLEAEQAMLALRQYITSIT